MNYLEKNRCRSRLWGKNLRVYMGLCHINKVIDMGPCRGEEEAKIGISNSEEDPQRDHKHIKRYFSSPVGWVMQLKITMETTLCPLGWWQWESWIIPSEAVDMEKRNRDS